MSGFTLVEAMIAMLLSSIVVILVSGVFLVQNEYYAVQISRSQAHDNARTVTELLGSELRSVMEDGILVAESNRLVVRSPMVLGVVCGQLGPNTTYAHFEGGETQVDTLEVSGFARRDASTGGWTYYTAQWRDISFMGGVSVAANACAGNGSDTTGIADDFIRLRRLRSYIGSVPSPGDVIMLYRAVEYEFDDSTMDPTAVGLYRGLYGETLTEYVTGMDASAQFLYRTGGTSYSAPVTGAALSTIDAVRIVAQARKRVRAGGAEDVTYGWSVNLPLRNAS